MLQSSIGHEDELGGGTGWRAMALRLDRQRRAGRGAGCVPKAKAASAPMCARGQAVGAQKCCQPASNERACRARGGGPAAMQQAAAQQQVA